MMPAHADVVERQVEGAVVFDQAVIADDRDTFGSGLFDGRPDSVLVPGVDDEGVNALRDQRVDVGQLLFGGRLGVGRDVFVASGFDGGLHRGFVDLPALFLELGPGHADLLALCQRGRREADLARTATRIALRISILPMDAASVWPVRRIRRYVREIGRNNFSCQNKNDRQTWGCPPNRQSHAASQRKPGFWRRLGQHFCPSLVRRPKKCPRLRLPRRRRTEGGAAGR